MSETLVELATGWVPPVDALVACAGEGACLLEAGAGARWSYLAPWPVAVLRRRDPAGVLGEARELLARTRADRPDGAPPFSGGLVGSLGYDLARAIEKLPVLARDDLGLPCVHLHAVESVIAFDHHEGVVHLCARSHAELARLQQVLDAARPAGHPAPPGSSLTPMPFAHYEPLVAEILQQIARGDVYEVNLTHRLSGPCASALDLYVRLRESSPVPRNLYLDAGGFTLVGATPETFLTVDGDRVVITCPIKGTRRRDDDVDADAALAHALWSDPKDRAENVMIVDLARNDLSRVCLPGSVTVPSLLAIESHPTVHQMVSTVRGCLAPEFDVFDLLEATFAPGSMTGAPKVRAMELIERLEPVRRGPYAGAVGWIAPDGTCDLAVVIRTAVVIGASAYLHVGGAIVADSVASEEYEESLLKARTVAAALGASILR